MYNSDNKILPQVEHYRLRACAYRSLSTYGSKSSAPSEAAYRHQPLR